MPDEIDKQIIRRLQANFPLVPAPYKQVANEIGISEAEVIQRLTKLRETGALRKLGAVLDQHQIGIEGNALCAWDAPVDRLDELGCSMARQRGVSHVYVRVPREDWPYNLYVVLHAPSRPECEEIAKALAEVSGLRKYVLLFSTHTWKRSQLEFF